MLLIASNSSHHKRKVFVIGLNKTGTRSAKKVFIDLSYDFGDQRTAELFLDDLMHAGFSGLLRFCQNAKAFKDIPLGSPMIYELLDKEFPGSQFILTIRDSLEQWCESFVTSHSMILQTSGVPTSQDLASSPNGAYQGFLLKAMTYIFPNMPLYYKDGCMNIYNEYNRDVVSFFHNRPNDLLVLNLASPTAYQDFCAF
ncbi:MAG: sulfotransferase [Cyanobacteriota bacterium]|nr:sulfotransferase [Cyanobacteriota bacterium]